MIFDGATGASQATSPAGRRTPESRTTVSPSRAPQAEAPSWRTRTLRMIGYIIPSVLGLQHAPGGPTLGDMDRTPLTPEAIAAALRDLDGWELRDGCLHREVVLADFRARVRVHDARRVRRRGAQPPPGLVERLEPRHDRPLDPRRRRHHRPRSGARATDLLVRARSAAYHPGHMSTTNRRTRLPSEVFDLPIAKIRDGYYSDAYFNYTKRVLDRDDHHPSVVLQVFQRKHAVLGGMDEAIAILRECSGREGAGRRVDRRLGRPRRAGAPRRRRDRAVGDRDDDRGRLRPVLPPRDGVPRRPRAAHADRARTCARS